jgi:hypothetical protein
MLGVLLLGATYAHAASVNLAWETTEQNHQGFKIYYGKQTHAAVQAPSGTGAAPYEQVVTLADPSARNATLDLPPGVYYFRLTLYSDQHESDFSNETADIVKLAAPSALTIDDVIVGP